MNTKAPQIPSAQDAIPEPVPSRAGALAESGENYLETILVMKERRDDAIVRAVDIANELRFSKPSVSRGLGQLKDKGLITIAPSGCIEFTPEGLEKARHIFRRHQVLTALLQEVARVPSDIAQRDACRVEHVISDETMLGIEKFLKEKGII
ncbi:MAG: metal-dependent transcriptional regulator [Aeromonadales bacterium]|nr:metal-dependent transcriptional regulator [Aeromonadales bacterium]MDY2891885.1 metal-dependent transcriptional regulator [Succinivibrio sp.]